jgi:hypothetical protein
MSEMDNEEKLAHAISHTEILRQPKQKLATFGTTNIYYYLITELTDAINVVREGRVVAERPRIVTPAYLAHLEGFSEQAKQYIDLMARTYPHEPGVVYGYRNEFHEMNVVSGPLKGIVDNINTRIDCSHDALSAIIKGVEESWDVSLLKFTYELTRRSLSSNLAEFENKGLLRVDEGGVPVEARQHIEELFDQVSGDLSQAPLLISELRRWNLFQQYQDRFLSLFKKS